MIDLNNHPAWKGNPLWGSVNPIKKRGHLLRLFLAQKYAKLFPREMFVGITGSVGKTTTAVACKLVLSQKYNTISTTDTNSKTANLDPLFNLPITILKIRPKIKRVILELGIEYPGEMELWLNIARPAKGIVTAINYAHSEYLGSVEQIAKEKGLLIEQLPAEGVAILNWDDLNTRKLSERSKAAVVFYGTEAKNCQVWAGNIRIENFRTVFELNYGVERVEIRSQLLGKHQIYPMLAAAALGITEDISLIKIKKALESLEPAEHRLQSKAGYNGSVILDDTYNSSPAAVLEALDTLNYLPARRRIVVLGEMRELGQFSEKLHRQVAQKIYNDKIDLVFLGGGDTKYIADELVRMGFLEERLQINLQTPQIVSSLLKILAKGDVVLVKGSRAVRLDEVVKKVTKK